ncbi:MAG: RNA polymerase sigma factor [Planctomycetes bacterium]|nr:RNA polymerase sigma factor [Planctomycetota bacterium]
MEFELFWRQTSERVRSYLRWVCGNEADVDDVLQECYMRALRGWGQYSGRGSREAWLFGIVKRTNIDWYRRHKRHVSQSLEQVGEEKLAVEPREDDRAEGIEQMIRGLKPEQQEIVYLRFAGGLSYEEIAQTVGVPVGTVRSRLHRGLKELRKKLKVES